MRKLIIALVGTLATTPALAIDEGHVRCASPSILLEVKAQISRDIAKIVEIGPSGTSMVGNPDEANYHYLGQLMGKTVDAEQAVRSAMTSDISRVSTLKINEVNGALTCRARLLIHGDASSALQTPAERNYARQRRPDIRQLAIPRILTYWVVPIEESTDESYDVTYRLDIPPENNAMNNMLEKLMKLDIKPPR